MTEIRKATERLKTGKATDPDDNLPKCVIMVVEVAPEKFWNMNLVLKQTFLTKWKTSKVNEASKPICLLDALHKLYEYIIAEKPEE